MNTKTHRSRSRQSRPHRSLWASPSTPPRWDGSPSPSWSRLERKKVNEKQNEQICLKIKIKNMKKIKKWSCQDRRQRGSPASSCRTGRSTPGTKNWVRWETEWVTWEWWECLRTHRLLLAIAARYFNCLVCTSRKKSGREKEFTNCHLQTFDLIHSEAGRLADLLEVNSLVGVRHLGLGLGGGGGGGQQGGEWQDRVSVSHWSCLPQVGSPWSPDRTTTHPPPLL